MLAQSSLENQRGEAESSDCFWDRLRMDFQLWRGSDGVAIGQIMRRQLVGRAARDLAARAARNRDGRREATDWRLLGDRDSG